MVIKKKVYFTTPKLKQMKNMNVKVSVKVTNGPFSKKAKKQNLVIVCNKFL